MGTANSLQKLQMLLTVLVLFGNTFSPCRLLCPTLHGMVTILPDRPVFWLVLPTLQQLSLPSPLLKNYLLAHGRLHSGVPSSPTHLNTYPPDQTSCDAPPWEGPHSAQQECFSMCDVQFTFPLGQDFQRCAKGIEISLTRATAHSLAAGVTSRPLKPVSPVHPILTKRNPSCIALDQSRRPVWWSRSCTDQQTVRLVISTGESTLWGGFPVAGALHQRTASAENQNPFSRWSSMEERRESVPVPPGQPAPALAGKFTFEENPRIWLPGDPHRSNPSGSDSQFLCTPGVI